MHRSILRLFIAPILLGCALAQAEDGECERPFDASAPYPTEAALLEQPRGWTFRQSPLRLPLYYLDDDRPNESLCYDGCATQWIPLQAPPDAKPIGAWSVVKRRDGRLQ